MSAAGAQADIARQGAALGMSAAEIGQRGAGLAGNLGQGQAQIGSNAANQMGALGLQGLGLQGRLGEGIGTLGQQYGQLNIAQGNALGQAGMRQASLGELNQNLGQREAGFLFDMGKQQQLQNQVELSTDHKNKLSQLYEPQNRLSWLSDLYKGAPSSSQSLSASTTPSTSTAQQLLGTGVGAFAALKGAQGILG
tara:strand:- start:96 stop:680 length:585 start_codon:yes stop_codon:yes gene_type:complete